jgi:hypothetical protein
MPEWIIATESPDTHLDPPTHTLPTPLSIPDKQQQLPRARLHLPQSSIIMSSHCQTTRGPPSNVTPSQAPPIVIFELNQARRAKVTRELEAVRSGMLSVCPQCLELDFYKSLSHAHYRRPNCLQNSWTGQLWWGSKSLSRRGLSTAR